MRPDTVESNQVAFDVNSWYEMIRCPEDCRRIYDFIKKQFTPTNSRANHLANAMLRSLACTLELIGIMPQLLAEALFRRSIHLLLIRIHAEIQLGNGANHHQVSKVVKVAEGDHNPQWHLASTKEANRQSGYRRGRSASSSSSSSESGNEFRQRGGKARKKGGKGGGRKGGNNYRKRK